MSKAILNGVDFYNIFKSGADIVKRNKENLNRINVFPVRDGDTGTNLALTMGSIADEAVVSEDFDIVIQSMADIAFENARGNSGIIFASFLGGFSSACINLKTIDLEQFSRGAELAVETAYSAVSEPVEGTMLTVIREWSNYITTNHNTHQKFSDLFEGAYRKANQALEETTDMLEVLKKNKVVDSGAKGFVMFLEGFSKFIGDFIHGNEKVVQSISIGHTHAKTAYTDHQSLKFRYCTEVLLKEDIKVKSEVEAMLDGIGDSLIVTGNERLVKIHVHTDRPDLITKLFADAGYKVYKSKVDDMLLQVQVEKGAKSNIGILTDSIADIEDQQLLSEQIHMIPLALIADESTYLDKLTATKDNLSSILNQSKTYPTSSQAEVRFISSKLEWLLGQYEHVIIFSVAKALSGTYTSYEKAIESFAEDKHRIHLVDTKLNSGAQGLIVLKAAQMANAGMRVDEIINRATDDISKTKILVSLDTFKYAVKSGRVPYRIGRIFVMLRAKPIMSLSLEGNGIASGLAFSRKAADMKIYRRVKKIMKQGGISQYSIVHSNNPELANAYKVQFEELIGFPPVITTEISAITAIHAGIGSVAIAFTRKE